jgi:hypothetical protein
VFFVVVLGMWELGETVLRHVLGAYDAWFARDRDSLTRYWLLARVTVVVLAFALDANESGRGGSLTDWGQCGVGI